MERTLVYEIRNGGSTPSSGATKFALLVQRLVFRFCSPAMAVRVRHGAPKLSGCIVSQVRRPALEVGGRRFESCHPDQ